MNQKSAKLEMTKDVLQEVTGGRPYSFGYFTGELGELVEEIKNRDWEAIKDEASDTAYAGNMIAHQATGLNFPLTGGHNALQKFRERNGIWRETMEAQGLPFSVDYLVGGSNFAKPHKVQQAFALAGKEIDDRTAQKLSEQMVSTLEKGDQEKRASRALLSLGTKIVPVLKGQQAKTVLNLGNRPMGELTAGLTKLPSIGRARAIDNAWVSPELMGRGYGTKLYGKAIRDAYTDFLKGGPRWVTSDPRRITSHTAQDLWQGLRGRGYPVTRDPSATLSPLRMIWENLPWKNPRYGIDLKKMRNFYKDLPR